MKTAMQELVDFMKQSPMMFAATLFMIEEHKLLEKEKQQIVKAVNETFESTSSALNQGRMDTPIDGNDYYNFTFKQ